MNKTPPPDFHSPEASLDRDHLVRVPVGEGSERWRTVQFERTVLMVVRTATTFIRLAQIAEHLLSDTRVQVLFTICDGRSAYARDLETELIKSGCVYIPWRQARTMHFDLAISASLNGPLAEVKAPLLLIDHGPGHTKNVSIPDGGNEEWRALLNADGQRRILALTNDGENDFFPDSFEKAVVGDPMLDAVLAARLRRDVFREQLGIGDRKLIALSSTWGAAASFATMPDFASELLRRLPSSEYAVASILHPNIWIGHGSWQVRVWYRDAVESGLILVPFDDAWQAVIVAADAVMGDHGSVTLYANMAGIPVARLSYDKADMKSEMEMVAAAEKTPLVKSVGEAVRFALEDHRIEEAATERARRLSFANVGTATRKFFELVYDILGIPPNATLKDPYDFRLRVRPQPPRSYYASVGDGGGTFSVRLFPAAVGRSEATCHATLIARIDEGNFRIVQSCHAAICSNDRSSAWRNACPNARYALRTGGGTTTLESREGELFAVESGLADPVVTCAAALCLIEREASRGEFSCGSAAGPVSVCRQAPTRRNSS